ncbi:DUF58 domain-containing protein [Niveibacterium sp. SC-1]|uniref:DUF58 domain-containing protein n=1 Tax=Niveibacterium sp. SC-1 TaxID=3135646 RepID=UPI00312032C1
MSRPAIAALRERLQRWMLRNRPPEALPILLRQRRVYVLPTGTGLSYGGMLLAMLIASLNYNLALGFALTFFLAGVGHLALLRAHRNLLGLSLQAGRAEPGFAGAPLQIELVFSEESGRERGPLRVGTPEDPSAGFELAARSPTRVACLLPARPRGRHRLGRLRVETRFPLGLVVAWAYLEPDIEAWVYPAPEPHPPAAPQGGTGERNARRANVAGDSELESLRPYRPGDSLRRIAWRRLSRGGPLITKSFSDPVGSDLSLNWQACSALPDVETRLSRLCAWVLQAESRGLRWSLSLPGFALDSGSGPEHARRALEALAKFGTAP